MVWFIEPAKFFRRMEYKKCLIYVANNALKLIIDIKCFVMVIFGVDCDTMFFSGNYFFFISVAGSTNIRKETYPSRPASLPAARHWAAVDPLPGSSYQLQAPPPPLPPPHCTWRISWLIKHLRDPAIISTYPFHLTHRRYTHHPPALLYCTADDRHFVLKG
jgi:hypothetical protein